MLITGEPAEATGATASAKVADVVTGSRRVEPTEGEVTVVASMVATAAAAPVDQEGLSYDFLSFSP